ncbi:MAG: hypothetical protein WA708_19850 [Acidobacteriaceae bacterium]
MWVVIAILFFVAWLATYFFMMSRVITYILLGLAIVSLIIHFMAANRRDAQGGGKV